MHDQKKPLKFESVYDEIKAQILSDSYENSDKLPSESILTATYNCSRPTLQKALRKLISENYVYTVQGSGTYINKNRILRNQNIENTQSQRQSLYGLIFPNLGEGYIFKPITDKIAQIISHMNCSLIWGGYISPSETNFKQHIVNICANYIELDLRGVFFSPFEYNDQAKEINQYIVNTLSQAGIPIILVDSDIVEFPKRSKYDIVSLNHTQAGYKITSHLLSKGLKKILFVTLPYSKDTCKLRLMGFHEALLDYGISPQKDWLVTLNPENEDEVREMLEKHKPDGIIGLIDRAAVNLINTLKRLNISVPQDLLIGGFDDLGYLFDMSISTIRQPLEEISSVAVQLMHDRENNPLTPPRIIVLSGELIIGKSTDLTEETSI